MQRSGLAAPSMSASVPATTKDGLAAMRDEIERLREKNLQLAEEVADFRVAL